MESGNSNQLNAQQDKSALQPPSGQPDNQVTSSRVHSFMNKSTPSQLQRGAEIANATDIEADEWANFKNDSGDDEEEKKRQGTRTRLYHPEDESDVPTQKIEQSFRPYKKEESQQGGLSAREEPNKLHVSESGPERIKHEIQSINSEDPLPKASSQEDNRTRVDHGRMVSVGADPKEEEKKNERNPVKKVSGWFNPKVQEAKKKKEKKLFLTSCEKEKSFEDIKSLKDVDTLHVKFTNLRLEDNVLIQNIEDYVNCIENIQSVNLEFVEFKKQGLSDHENFSTQLEGIVNAVFREQRYVEKIKVSWKYAKGADILLRIVSRKFHELKGRFNKFSFTFNGKISCKDFSEFIGRVRLVEGDLTAFKIKGDLHGPEGLTQEIQRPLSMMRSTKFCLSLTCSGPFGNELVNFAIKSLVGMKDIKDLRIVLIMEDFVGNNTEEMTKEMFENIGKINGNMETLYGILCLGKSDVEMFKKFIETARKGMRIIKLKELKIGTHPTNSDKLLDLKTQTEIKKHWNEK